MGKQQSLIENLEIFLNFMRSDDYAKMIVLSRTDADVNNFITDIHIRYDSICFFQEIEDYHSRAVQESHQLAQKICDFLGYE